MRQKCTRRLWIHQAISGSMCSFWMLEPMEPQAPLRLHNISYPFLGFEPWSHGQCSGSIQFWVQWEEFRWALTSNRKHEKAFCFRCRRLGVKTEGSPTGKSSSEFDVFALSRFEYASRDVCDAHVVLCVRRGARDRSIGRVRSEGPEIDLRLGRFQGFVLLFLLLRVSQSPGT